jgi:hypothetical protein
MKRYLDINGALREVVDNEDHVGDSLWRTALFVISRFDKKKKYSEQSEETTRAIVFCRDCYDHWENKFWRHSNHNLVADNCSRDQAFMHFVMLKYIGMEGDLEWFAKTLGKQISPAARFTIDSWNWFKSLTGNKWRAWWFVLFSSYFLLDNGKSKFYHIHIYCWMLWSAPQIKWVKRRKKTILKKLKKHHGQNILCRMLLGDQISFSGGFKHDMFLEGDRIDCYLLTPRTDFQWQRNQKEIKESSWIKPYNGDYKFDIDILKRFILYPKENRLLTKK